MALRQNTIDQLTAALRFRRIEEGITLMERIAGDLETIDASTAIPEAFPFWLHSESMPAFATRGFSLRFSTDSVARFRKQMTVDQYLQLRLADGFCALAMRQSDEAIRILELVIQARHDLGDSNRLALAHFWKGRAHRKKGEYESALTHIGLGHRPCDGFRRLIVTNSFLNIWNFIIDIRLWSQEGKNTFC